MGILASLTTVAVAAELRPDELYRRTLPSVMTLLVENRDGSTTQGTAFLALREGVAVTAWHVVKGAKGVKAKFSTGEEVVSPGLIARDESRDVALIRIPAGERPLLRLGDDDPPVGTRLYAIGAPRGLEFSISDGLLSQVHRSPERKEYQFTCPISPGNSGGPLLLADGSVAGVVSWQRKDGQNLNFAAPASTVLKLDPMAAETPWNKPSETPKKPASFGPEWRQYEDQRFGFGVWMPADPKKSSEPVKTDVGEVIIHKFQVDGPMGSYFVSVSQYPEELIRMSDPERMLDGARDGAVGNVKGRLLAEYKTSLSGHPGRDLTLTTQGFSVRTRIFMVGNRLYMVMMVFPSNTVRRDHVQDYLKSFRLLDTRP